MFVPDSWERARQGKNCHRSVRVVLSCQNLFRCRRVQAILICLFGCNMGKECEPSAGSEEQPERRLSVEDARQALIRMIEEDHAKDRLLQGALPYLRTMEAKQVGDGVVEIGAWTCRLNDKRFTGDYVSLEQSISAQFKGDFVLDERGQWKGVVTTYTRND
jgi:hypothetical protein